MSLVMTFATNDYVVMSGDYRRVMVDNRNIYFDDCPKVFPVNKKVLYGFTGDSDVHDYVRVHLKVKDNETVQAVVRKARKLIRAIRTPDIYYSMQFAGISDSGKHEIINISHRDNFKSERTTIPKDGIKWIYAFANEDPEELIQKEFESLSNHSSDSLINMAAKVNKAVGEKDNDVSEECTVLRLEQGEIKMFESVPKVIDTDNV